MFDLQNLDRITSLLVSRAGGYLRNTIREPRTTCQVCATPVDGYKQCAPCSRHSAQHGLQLADAVGVLTYGVGGKQSGYAMRGYKGAQPLDEHIAVVTLLTRAGIALHGNCAGVMARVPVTHWAAVPSLPPKPGPHPFHQIVAAALPGNKEVVLRGSPQVADPRAAAIGQFTTTARLLPQSHVLVLDDTWTQGGHAQSAALTLRQAGAGIVSILAAARWLNPKYGSNNEFINQRLTEDFNPQRCPWTGNHCPRA